jgi:uncharacterized membrane protein
LGDEYTERNNEIEKIYEGSYEQLKSFAEKNNISYIYVSSYEKNDYSINSSMLEKLEKVYDANSIQLYKIN